MRSYSNKEGRWRQINPRNQNNDEEVKKGPWASEEDAILIEYVRQNGEKRWSHAREETRLKRLGKNCRLRWIHYLRPNLKKCALTTEEEQRIIQLHDLYGNKWSQIASQLPGRTDNEMKNYWKTRVRRQQRDASMFLDIQHPDDQGVTHVDSADTTNMSSTKSDDDLDTYTNQTFTSLLMNGAKIEPFGFVPGLNADPIPHEPGSIPYIVGGAGAGAGDGLELLPWNNIANGEHYHLLPEGDQMQGGNERDGDLMFEAAEMEVMMSLCNENSHVISDNGQKSMIESAQRGVQNAMGDAILSSEHQNKLGDDDEGQWGQQEMEIFLDAETIRLLDEFHATIANDKQDDAMTMEEDIAPQKLEALLGEVYFQAGPPA